MRVKVLAREVYYDGRGRLTGEVFEADERWAAGRLLTKQIEKAPEPKPFRRADIVPPVRTVALPEPTPIEPEVSVDEDAPQRRQYRTRRMKADDAE